MTAQTPKDGADAAALRAEHDALAQRLEIRISIDHLRRGLLRTFFGLISAGVTVKLGWDRWGTLKPGAVRRFHAGPPLFLWLATGITLVLLVLAVTSLLRARRLGREEDALFARLRRLRADLGLTP